MNNNKVICEISDTSFDSSYQMGDLNTFKIRRASRGILVNENKIALLNVAKHNYYKLHGGGIEKGESLEEAFKRELLEEVGSDCEIIDQGGIVIEWRDQWKLMQISYVFLAKTVGQIRQNKLEQSEIEEGFELEWIPIEETEEIFKEYNPANYEGNFIKKRDTSIFEFYKDRLVNLK